MSLDDSIKDLTGKVAAETSVDASAVAALNGIAQLLKDALAAAAAAGATPVQLQALTDLSTTMTTNRDALAAAVTANTTPAAGATANAGPATLSRGLDGGGGMHPSGGMVGSTSSSAVGAAGGPSSADALKGKGAGMPGASQMPGDAMTPVSTAAPGVATTANIGGTHTQQK